MIMVGRIFMSHIIYNKVVEKQVKAFNGITT